jgi:hypothetical protein
MATPCRDWRGVIPQRGLGALCPRDEARDEVLLVLAHHAALPVELGLQQQHGELGIRKNSNLTGHSEQRTSQN